MTTAGARSRRRGPIAWLASLDDGLIIRSAFYGLLLGTAAVLFVDYRELSANQATELVTPDMPILPAFDPDSPDMPQGPDVTSDPETLKNPLTANLTASGVLDLSGTIDVGAADRVAAEIAAHGEYVQTVKLNSPGGSVQDAIKIGRLLREKGYTTSVAAGEICASSCPLALAGGKDRLATAKSAIGVHQIYATAPADATQMLSAGNAMSDAQRTTAEISRYLKEMGVDGELWLHALETPPNRLYYLSADELVSLKLITKLQP